MIYGVQYYRPPFPENRQWEKDFALIRETGFNTVQFWVTWGWVEPEPGKFIFEDYDQLIALAAANGLQVILSTCAELQPYWIHRIIPDSCMIDHMGHQVISSNRSESNQGLTPGGCTDHPEVLALMRNFLVKTAEQYRDTPNLYAWDCWNEIRWQINADGIVCHCPHTLNSFRDWLKQKYNGLDDLNRAWKRRYATFDDVLPGKLPHRPYTEMMEFESFMQWRVAEHLKFRYQTIKNIDGKHPVTAHSPGPTPVYPWGPQIPGVAGDQTQHALHAGNDWDLAAQVDILGSSHFPTYQTGHLAEFGTALEVTHSAAMGKVFWVSELEGGSYHAPVIPVRIWTAYARGAKAINLWSWRNEVFGGESGTGGIVSDDGHTEQRLTAYRETGAVIRDHHDLLENYCPDPAKAGLFFSPEIYNYDWASAGSLDRARDSLAGYGTAFEMLGIPYIIVESSRLTPLENLKVLFMPWPVIIPPPAAEKILMFVKSGGTLIIEGDADAVTPLGFYRYPGTEREFAFSLGIDCYQRRSIKPHEPWYRLPNPKAPPKPAPMITKRITFQLDGAEFALDAEMYYTPLKPLGKTKILAKDEEGNILAFANTVGKGKVVALASFFGRNYLRTGNKDFERFLSHICEKAEVMPEITISAREEIQWRAGRSGIERLLFVINPSGQQKVTISGSEEIFAGEQIKDMATNRHVKTIVKNGRRSLAVELPENGYVILVWPAEV